MAELFIKYYFIIPTILIAITVGLTIHGVKKRNKYMECEGVITQICKTTSHTSPGETALYAMVAYTVNGHSFEFHANYYSTSMKVGDKITVLYDPNDYSKATIKTGTYAAPLIVGALALFSIIPLIIFTILRSKGILTF